MALRAVGLKTHIWNNNLRSIMLLAGFPVLLLVMLWTGGTLLPLSYGGTVEDALSSGNTAVLLFGHWVIVGALIWFIISWFFHNSMINAATDAHPVSREEEPRLYNLLENLCISRGLPMPKLQIINAPGLNAFASGINNKTYAITVTRGLLDALEDDEIEAVLAHELTHIMNRDVRLLIVAVIFVGMIGFLAQTAFRMLVYGPRSGYSRDRRGSDARLMLIGLLVLAIGYFFALLIRFGLSRKREYMADAGAVELTKNPEGMMRALLRISGNDYVEETPADIEQMCIENSHPFMGVFATHPPIKDRVNIISEATGIPVPSLKDQTYTELHEKNPWR